MIISTDDIKDFVDRGLEEDCPLGDITTDALIASQVEASFKIVAKEESMACGAAIGVKIFETLSTDFSFDYIEKDGVLLKPGDVLLKGKGPCGVLLKLERLVLNLLQRLSAISYNTKRYVQKIDGTSCQLLDTRKTTPGLRRFEKYAVKVGGGTNHRMGLSDLFLLKENHLAMEARSERHYILSAIEKCRNFRPKIRVEVEVKNEAELIEAFNGKADIVMLDNMTPEQVKELLEKHKKGSTQVEVSGGITLDSIREYALSGVDFISVGSLTHSVKAADLSLLVEEMSLSPSSKN